METGATTPSRISAVLWCAAIAGVIALLALTLAAAFRRQTPQGELEIARARGRVDAAAAVLTERLMSELTEALEKGGPLNAVRVCSEIAQEVTRALGAEKDLVLKRTSLKTRNPANAPDDFERAWLERAEAALAARSNPERLYEVRPAPGGRLEFRHLRPIIFPGGVCSHCHGLADEIDPEVRDLLRQRYPHDQATGFKPGELRGAISVRVTLPEGITVPTVTSR